MHRSLNISPVLLVSAVAVFCGIPAPAANAEFVLSVSGVPVVETFDDYRGLGFSATPSAGQLDSTTYRAVGFSAGDGTFGGEFTSDDFARGTSTGGVTTGGAYAFQVSSGDYALGVQPTGSDFTPGELTIAGRNQTGATLLALNVTADVLTFNDANRASEWTFSGSLDDSFYLPFETITSPAAADANPVWVSTRLGGLVPLGAGVADGDSFFIQVRGIDAGGSGSRDEFAINNLSITGITAIPEPTGLSLLVGILGGVIAVRRRRR